MKIELIVIDDIAQISGPANVVFEVEHRTFVNLNQEGEQLNYPKGEWYYKQYCELPRGRMTVIPFKPYAR